MKLMQFLMGLNDVYQPIRSSFLTRESLPTVKDAFTIVSREEYPPGYIKPNSKNGCKYGFSANVNVDVSQSNASQSSQFSSSPLSFTNDQMVKLMALINDMPYGSIIHANLAEISQLNHLNLFDSFDDQSPKRPYDEEMALPNDEGRTPQSTRSSRTANVEDGSTTSMGDKSISEGNNQNIQNVFDSASNNNNDVRFDIPSSLFPVENSNDVQPEPTRSSSRIPKMLAKFNDYVVNSSKIYGLEKVVEAMNAEIEALNRNNTWVITDLLVGRKPIQSKWIFKIKYKALREVERYKARLVAKGFGKKEGIDYEETFSPVVKMIIVRCLINIVVQNDWPLYHLDVNNAFLYGDLYEDVYMSMSPGFSGFGTSFVALLVYVDDIVITGSDDKEIERFKSFLK
ncbi:ribonuclease H-like domain-containing protein, partial [Tanacetum coccineum]